MTETRLRAIVEVVADAYPREAAIATVYDAGYYWIRIDDGDRPLIGFLSRDEIWQWTDKYAAAVVLLRMALTDLEHHDEGWAG